MLSVEGIFVVADQFVDVELVTFMHSCIHVKVYWLLAWLLVNDLKCVSSCVPHLGAGM